MGYQEILIIPLMLLALLVPILVIVAVVYFSMKSVSRDIRAAVDEGFAKQREAIEQQVRAISFAPPTPTSAKEIPAQPKISEDKLMILGAVLACHFGKRVKIRSARVITVGSGSNVWSQQGRAAVQASHSVMH